VQRLNKTARDAGRFSLGLADDVRKDLLDPRPGSRTKVIIILAKWQKILSNNKCLARIKQARPCKCRRYTSPRR
jgi:hypothetical protein